MSAFSPKSGTGARKPPCRPADAASRLHLVFEQDLVVSTPVRQPRMCSGISSPIDSKCSSAASISSRVSKKVTNSLRLPPAVVSRRARFTPAGEFMFPEANTLSDRQGNDIAL